MFVELEFSTSENLLVKKLRLETEEDNFLSLYHKDPDSLFMNRDFFCSKQNIKTVLLWLENHRFVNYTCLKWQSVNLRNSKKNATVFGLFYLYLLRSF